MWWGHSRLVRGDRHRPNPSAATRRRVSIALAAIAVPLLAVTLWLGQQWQVELHELMGERTPDSYAWVRILLLGLVSFGLVVALVQALRWLVRTLAGRLAPVVPRHLARPLAVGLVAALVVGLNNGLVWRVLVEAANSFSSLTNSATKPGDSRPAASERSGSPSSLSSWDTLGRQGRDFVAGGPSQAQLTTFSGAAATQPVRVYAGLESSPTTRQRTALAVRELQRAGGFDRSVLVVMTTTGTGLVEPANADALEHMYNGDSAIVAMQYSYLPSWISFLVDQEKAHEAGRELFNQVYDAWLGLPAASRPRLMVSGTSLGAFGGEGRSADSRTSGTARMGWSGLVRPRPACFTVSSSTSVIPAARWLPVADGGRQVVFAADASDLRRPAGSRRPDVLYLQNGSDPIVRWTPRLLFDRPDWLSSQQPATSRRTCSGCRSSPSGR